jgi:hypothetical protein
MNVKTNVKNEGDEKREGKVGGKRLRSPEEESSGVERGEATENRRVPPSSARFDRVCKSPPDARGEDFSTCNFAFIQKTL